MQSDASVIPLQAGQLFSIQTWFMSHGTNNQLHGCGTKKPKYPLWSTRTLQTPAVLQTEYANEATATNMAVAGIEAVGSQAAGQWQGNKLRCDDALTAIMTGVSYATSAEMAGELGAFDGYARNAEHMLRQYGKAGAMRWRGIRPTVRGVVMNPVDHPHGGGEGKTSGGRHPVTPWGVPTKGYKTRSNKRTDKFIVRRRDK